MSSIVIVVVADVLRFKVVGSNSDVSLEDVVQSLLSAPALGHTRQRHAKAAALAA